MKRVVLMIAFQFPPYAGSSAVQRTLRFVRYLPEFGWEPIVLTANAGAYEFTSQDQMADIPRGAIIERAFCVDTARHLGLLRRYPSSLARPDRSHGGIKSLACNGRGPINASWRAFLLHRSVSVG